MGVTRLYQKSLALSYLMIVSVRVTALHVRLQVGVLLLLVLHGVDAGVGCPVILPWLRFEAL